MRERTGYVYNREGKWFARITFTDETGKRRELKRKVASESAGNILLKKLAKGLRTEQIHGNKPKTFSDLAELYELCYAIPARFIDGHKIEGMRGHDIVRLYVKTFRAYFGSLALDRITYDAITQFRNSRLRTDAFARTKRARPRSIASVNRELATLRRMLSVAVQRGWIESNPFRRGDALIITAAEKRRERILSGEEERRLLDACNTPSRRHVRRFLIALLDTGARKGEVSKLEWKDVDLMNNVITFRAENCKTLRERKVGLTPRLHAELSAIRKRTGLVFATKNLRSYFESACREAGIQHGGLNGLTLHCLRHTAATRLVKGKMPIQFVGRVLGHSQASTTYRYVTADRDTLREAADILASYSAD